MPERERVRRHAWAHCNDRPVIFDLSGKPVGIALRDALLSMDLREYNEAEVPTASLTQAEIDNSYSILHTVDETGVGILIFRIRGTSIDPFSGADLDIGFQSVEIQNPANTPACNLSLGVSYIVQ
ncbi:MAG: hypothetical protein L0H83_10565 [Salinisphaera sp.]|nr:hypothetical protein [Salinisphaera sp.]